MEVAEIEELDRTYRSARKQRTSSIFFEGFLHVLPRLLWCQSFRHVVF